MKHNMGRLNDSTAHGQAKPWVKTARAPAAGAAVVPARAGSAEVRASMGLRQVSPFTASRSIRAVCCALY